MAESALKRAESELQALRREQQNSRSNINKLEKELERLKDAAEQAMQRGGQGKTDPHVAMELIGQAEQSLKRVRKEPHALFAPGQLEVIEQTFERCREWLRSGLTDAAAALAAVVQTQALLLAARMEEERKEWLGLYRACAARAEPMLARLRACLTQPIDTPSGRFLRDEACLDYFSSGQFSRVNAELEELDRRLLSPMRGDSGQAFRSGSLPTGAELAAWLRTSASLERRCEAAVLAADREMYLSDEREEVRRRITERLRAEGYTAIDGGFEEGPLSAVFVTAELMGSLRLRFIIAPVREQGVVRANAGAVTCEELRYGSAEQAAELCAIWSQRIRQECPEIAITPMQAGDILWQRMRWQGAAPTGGAQTEEYRETCEQGGRLSALRREKKQ